MQGEHRVAPLKNQRRELFAQALARGNTTDDAYAEAGFSPNRGNAARLKANESISIRVAELQEKAEKRFYLTKQYVIDALIENAEKALGRRPVRLGNANEIGKFEDVYVYEAAAANAAIKMAGVEVGLFVDRKDVRLVTSEYDKMTDAELAQRLAEAAKFLLAGPVIEHDEIDLIGGSPSVQPESRARSR
jgi:phage terminase small subunit